MTFGIRKAVASDISDISALVAASVRGLGKGYYSGDESVAVPVGDDLAVECVRMTKIIQ